MAPSLLLLLLPSVLLYLYFLLQKLVLSPKSHSLIAFQQNRHRLIHWFTHLLAHSPTQTLILARSGSKNQMIVTANPANVEHILKTNFRNYPKGKPFTDLLGDFLGIGIFNADGKLWSTQRKLASHQFSTKSLREFAMKVLENEVANRLFPVMQTAAKNGAVLDMQDVLKRFAFDTICQISLGSDPGCLDYTRPVPPLSEAFDVAAEASAARGVAPAGWWWKAKRMLNVGSERRLRTAVKVVHSAVNDMIANKKANMDEKSGGDDLLSRFISAGHGGDLVRDMVISFLMAGKDTTSAAMTWLLWLLTWHPTVHTRVMDELISDTNNVIPEKLNLNSLTYDRLKGLSYLKACLCESMRLYPPVVWDSKHADADDVLPDGTPVFRGNRVMYFPYGMGRMEALWGNDCLEFRPDRWFAEPGVLKAENPYKFPVFQAGPRVCLGKEMAFMQMTYVVGSVLKRFEIMPVGPERPVYVPLLTAHMAGGFKVRVRERSG